MSTFSQRMGIKPVREMFQIDSMDKALRNRLWNYCRGDFFTHMVKSTRNFPSYRATNNYCIMKVWTEFFKERYIELRSDGQPLFSRYERLFADGTWNEVYDLLEFLVNSSYTTERDKHIKSLNEILEEEMSGVRFSEGMLIPITTEIELQSIDDAQGNSAARTHLQQAMMMLSDRTSPDYRNSVKESISALEGVVRKYTDERTLGRALNKIDKLTTLNPQFKRGIENLYAYTNDEGTGIRHALLEEGGDVDFDDAKLMLILCSALINYFTGKLRDNR